MIKGVWSSCLWLMISITGWCGGKTDAGSVWVVEQDFVKFGKKEAYEKYKKETLEHFTSFVRKGTFSFICLEAGDGTQYLFLTPLDGFSGMESLMQKRNAYRKELSVEAWNQKLLPYFSTINFTIETLHYFLPNCSSIPAGKEEITSSKAVYYCLFGIIPGNAQAFEDHLKAIAEAQAKGSSPICFRVWRTILGADIPKYVVAVFADSEKAAAKAFDQLGLITLPLKNIVRSERSGTALVRQDLSVINR